MSEDLAPLGAAPPGPGGPSLAEPAPRSRSRVRWLAGGIVAAVFLAGGAGAAFLVTGHHPGTIVLPARLLGLSRYTGPGGQGLERKMDNDARSAAGGFLTAPRAAVYGDPNGLGFALVVGAACPAGGCVVNSATPLVQALRAHGYAGARSFPPGPGADLLVCYRQPIAAQVFSCLWIDQARLGAVLFSGGSASGLADAAAKTRQIRAAIER